MKKKEETRELELFRYGIIAPLVYNEESNVRKFCKEAAEKKYYYKGKDYQYSEDTIRKWYYKYQNDGFDKMGRKIRKDNNESRKLTSKMTEYINLLKSEYPKITTKNIYKKLKDERYTKEEDINIQTFYRYIKNNKMGTKTIATNERRRFEQENPNDCWQADTTYGPYIVEKGNKYRTYLIQIIDDNSRLIMGYGFYYHDNADNVQRVLKKAVEKYGIPKKLYLDNGKNYKNNELEKICARLGIKKIHTHPYDPEAKGKVERCFKTIKEGWMYCQDFNQFHCLEDLEKSYQVYLYEEYINKIHSEIEDTPNNKWHKGIEEIEIRTKTQEELDTAFMNSIIRTVGKDRTVSIDNKLYEVPYKYVREAIEIRYCIDDKEKMWIYENEERKEELKRLNKIDNSKIKRETIIDYSKVINNEEDVEEKEG